MVLQSETLQKYKNIHEQSYKYFMRATEILKDFTDRSYEAYIIGDALRNLLLLKKISHIEIVTSATTEEIHNIFPAMCVDKNSIPYIKDASGIFFFSSFDDDTESIAGKYAEQYYNKKLTKTLQERIFTCNALSLSPNFNLTDLFTSVDDIHNRLIRTINKPKLLFKKHPEAILDALLLVSNYGLEIEPKTLKGAVKCSSLLENIDEVYLITMIRKIISGRYAYDALEIIKKHKLFKYLPKFDIYVKKVYSNYELITKNEMIAVLYLIVGEIKDANCFLQEELFELKTLMSNTRLILTEPITAVMVYYVGKNNLLSADRVASVFNSRYKSQYKHITKLDRKCVIKDIRDFDLTDLELQSLLVHQNKKLMLPIKNILLQEVINRDIQNHNKLLKQEAINISDQLDEIFGYVDPEVPVTYDDNGVKELHEKFKRQYDLLLKVYLSDEEEIYNLKSTERADFIKDCEQHARDFLLATDQYKILQERGLI